MKNNILYINLIIYIIHLKQSFSYLVLPFKTRPSQINDTEKNITLFLSSLVDNNIFINLDIGEPKQTIEVFLRSDTNDFYLSEKPSNDSKTNDSRPFMFDVGSDISKYFDQNNSISLDITNESINSYPSGAHIGNVSNDYLYFTNNENKIIKKRIPFILYHSIMRHSPGVIGLEAITYENDKKYNFIDKLKMNDVIESYYWMINYTSDNEGDLIIGEQPHIIDPLNYKEEDLFRHHPFLEDSMVGWGLIFDDINFKDKYFREFHESYFNYGINYIKGVVELEKELDKYFNESIQDGICYKVTIKYSYYPFKIYYCDKDKYKDNIKNFPKLTFFQYDFNYTFELDYTDLFKEKGDKIILMIFFDEAPFDWYLGKPFLKKYSFLMNQDSKIVGFYKRKDYKNSDNSNDDNNVILKIILIVIGVIILLILGIFIGKYFFKNKKKHKNILDEDYDYTTKIDDIN